jgi:hypothetical protein
MVGLFMEYVRKICPVCGNEFFVLKSAERKAVYCTLECLAKIQEDSDSLKCFLSVEE